MRTFDSDSSGDAVLTLAALHGLRLKGFVDTAAIVEQVALVAPDAGVDFESIDQLLGRLAAEGLVRRVEGERPGWALTATGRADHERLLAAELDATGRRAELEQAYRDFLPLNADLLATCTRWQVLDVDRGVLNDHADPDYDKRVIDDLVAIDVEAQALIGRLAAILDRFAPYGPALATAVAKVLDGDLDWFARPTLASYHTLWFELHEDLLATLGLDRAAETNPDSTQRSRRET